MRVELSWVDRLGLSFLAPPAIGGCRERHLRNQERGPHQTQNWL